MSNQNFPPTSQDNQETDFLLDVEDDSQQTDNKKNDVDLSLEEDIAPVEWEPTYDDFPDNLKELIEQIEDKDERKEAIQDDIDAAKGLNRIGYDEDKIWELLYEARRPRTDEERAEDEEWNEKFNNLPPETDKGYERSLGNKDIKKFINGEPIELTMPIIFLNNHPANNGKKRTNILSLQWAREGRYDSNFRYVIRSLMGKISASGSKAEKMTGIEFAKSLVHSGILYGDFMGYEEDGKTPKIGGYQSSEALTLAADAGNILGKGKDANIYASGADKSLGPTGEAINRGYIEKNIDNVSDELKRLLFGTSKTPIGYIELDSGKNNEKFIPPSKLKFLRENGFFETVIDSKTGEERLQTDEEFIKANKMRGIEFYEEDEKDSNGKIIHSKGSIKTKYTELNEDTKGIIDSMSQWLRTIAAGKGRGTIQALQQQGKDKMTMVNTIKAFRAIDHSTNEKGERDSAMAMFQLDETAMKKIKSQILSLNNLYYTPPINGEIFDDNEGKDLGAAMYDVAKDYVNEYNNPSENTLKEREKEIAKKKAKLENGEISQSEYEEYIKSNPPKLELKLAHEIEDRYSNVSNEQSSKTQEKLLSDEQEREAYRIRLTRAMGGDAIKQAENMLSRANVKIDAIYRDKQKIDSQKDDVEYMKNYNHYQQIKQAFGELAAKEVGDVKQVEIYSKMHSAKLLLDKTIKEYRDLPNNSTPEDRAAKRSEIANIANQVKQYNDQLAKMISVNLFDIKNPIYHDLFLYDNETGEVKAVND
ncbi:MAG: hypothetical protein LBM09_03145 [Candidatus Nomurabacteria bacterium]|jgi:hypothetical protein|nr:hypothetical protein [Candidatus Nomurabacteria bacterium]